MFCVAKVPWARALFPPTRIAAAAEIEKARRVNTLLFSVRLQSREILRDVQVAGDGLAEHAWGVRSPTLPRTVKGVNHAGPRREKEGRYVIVTPTNSLYATDEISAPPGLGRSREFSHHP